MLAKRAGTQGGWEEVTTENLGAQEAGRTTTHPLGHQETCSKMDIVEQ